jgi:hypothetical protein
MSRLYQNIVKKMNMVGNKETVGIKMLLQQEKTISLSLQFHSGFCILKCNRYQSQTIHRVIQYNYLKES